MHLPPLAASQARTFFTLETLSTTCTMEVTNVVNNNYCSYLQQLTTSVKNDCMCDASDCITTTWKRSSSSRMQTEGEEKKKKNAFNDMSFFNHK